MDDCCDHGSQFAPRVHPDRGHKAKQLGEHERAVGHPAKHTGGKMLSQLNPDHGPHKGAGKHY